MAAAAVISDSTPHYWSYKALLEDKKRCLTNVGNVKHEFCNSLEKEGVDPKTSQRALAERTRHHRGELEKTWHRGGAETPPHDYASTPGKPHFSQQEFQEKKKLMQTGIRRNSPRRSLDLGRSETAERIVGAAAQSQQGLDYDNHNVGTLLNFSQYMDNTGFLSERAALSENRSEPHNSQKVLTMKKRHHATSLNSTRDLRRSRSESPRTSNSREVADPTIKSYQGLYPYGETSQAYPNGCYDDDNKSGRYKSHAYMSIDKRRHAATIDGDASAERGRLRDLKQHAAEHHELYAGESEIYKPDFLARGDKYKSQYALQQHKKRHLAEIHSGGDQHYETESHYNASPYAGEGHRLGQSMDEKGLFTSQKALCFAKRGHIVDLHSVDGLVRRRAASARSDHSDSSSSCDVGKGISRMMHNHREDQVHSSHTEFTLKKKNHATSVHKAPKNDDDSDCTSVSSRASFGMHALNDTRRGSDPHHSCRAFALKKKYHVTPVHVKSDSRLHPERTKHRSVDMDPKSLASHAQLSKMKRVHRLESDAPGRSKSEPRPRRPAPTPRSGQWTPQHLD